MIRLLNVLAIACLVGTAIFAYSVKYETIFRAEKIVQLHEKLQAETDAIGTLRAEWEHVSRPERIGALADQFLTLQQPSSDADRADHGPARQRTAAGRDRPEARRAGPSESDQYPHRSDGDGADHPCKSAHFGKSLTP